MPGSRRPRKGERHPGSNRAVAGENSSRDSGGYMWTDERIEDLKKLWASGATASQIAGHLGGVTRNAVIGKVHRLGLSGRATIGRNETTRRQRRRAALKIATTSPNVRESVEREGGPDAWIRARMDRPPEALPEPRMPDVATKTFDQLEPSDCKWPVGDPRAADFGYCGCKAAVGLPYCEDHARRAFKPPAVRPNAPSDKARAPMPLPMRAVRHLVGT